MAAAAERQLGQWLRGGLCIPTDEATSFDSARGVICKAGGHPTPNAGSEQAGRQALALAASVGADGLLLVLLSGGASAAMAVPAPGISLADKRRTTELLLAGGADIQALNIVRKHLSAVKGGWLAACTPGRCRALAISDVVGDDLSVIASGPTVADPTSFADAIAVLERVGGRAIYPDAVVNWLTRGAEGLVPETPKPGDERLARSNASVIGSRADAMQGAAREAAHRGYRVVVRDAPVVGDARQAAQAYFSTLEAQFGRGGPAQRLPRPVCIVSSGETTVTVAGGGRGGRNQEFALAALDRLAALAPAALASVGTDGVDGPTDAAGAIVDDGSGERAARAGLSPASFLANNNAYEFFAAIDELLITGPTGTNVGDLQILLLA
jgi:hydroxypyruvate reductase